MKSRLFAIVLLVTAFLSVWAAVRDYFIGDLFLARAIQKVSATPWEETMEVVSFIGATFPMLAIALALFAWFLWKRRQAECYAVFAVLLGFGVSPILKALVDRPRPTADLVSVWRYFDGLGFPSGHALNAVLLFGLLFYLAPLLVPWRGAVSIIRTLLVALIGLMGVSRVYLGAHWPSDVLGGFLYGAIVLAALVSFHGWLARRYGGQTPAKGPYLGQ